MKYKLFSLFVALVATTALRASNVITYKATEKLQETTGNTWSDGLHINAFNVAITSHEFSNGTGAITFADEVTTIGKAAFHECEGLTSVTIPNSVTTIGSSAFDGCSDLTSITFGSSVTTIGNWAFSDCKGLTSINVDASNTHYSSVDGVLFNYAKDTLIQYPVGNPRTQYTIPNSVKTIEHGAFEDCKGLTSVTIGNSVTTIGDWAFRSCSGLTSVTIGNSVIAIGKAAFEYCKGLKSIFIPNSVITIGNDAFSYCNSLTSVTIGNSVTTIEYNAFSYCESLTSVTIPNSVTTLGERVFEKCKGLTSVTIGNSVTTIGKWAFSNCESLTSVTIPNSVTTIEYGALYGCKDLTSINVGASNTHYSSVDGVLFNYAKDTLIQYPLGDTRTKYTIPNSVKTIEDHAFEDCSALTSVTIPNSVTTIGYKAFLRCSNLTSVTIGNSVTSIEKWAFEGCTSLPVENNLRYADTYLIGAVNKKLSTYSIKKGTKWIGDDAFKGCSNLTSITIPNSVKTIGEAAFSYCKGLTSVMIPNSVTTIGWYAFSNCKSLTSVTIPNSVTTIENWAFSNCESLTSLTIGNSVTTIGESAFKSCSALTSVTIPNSLKTIKRYVFENCSSLTSVTIPNSVKTVSSLAFTGCTSLPVENNLRYADTYLIGAVDGTLSTYSIKKGTKWIGDHAFEDCSALTSITIPNSVKTIGWEAFSNCKSLTSVTIPNSVTTIGYRAFEDCSGLTSVTFGSSVTTIENWAFSDCKGLTSINVDASNTHYSSVDGVLFNYAKDTLIMYPASSTRIEYTIPNSVTAIEHGTFSDCKNLTLINVDASNTHYSSVDGVLFNYAKGTLLQYPASNPRTKYTIPNSVKTIGSSAFEYCSNLTSITIPNSVTTIGSSAFEYCSNLTSITIPNSVTTIGWDAFRNCKGLTSVTILNPNVEIDTDAFENCTIADLYCGTSVDLSKAKGEIKNIHRLSDEELLFLLPFDQYARQYVEPRINEWQKKGEFEKTTDWKKRVNETTRKQKIDALVRVAKKEYLTNYQKNNNLTFTLGTYDADNEVYLVQCSNKEDLLVAVPFADASYVKQNWEKHKASLKYEIQGTEVVLTSVTFSFTRKKTYTYKPDQKLTYSTPDINYNFDPIELPEMQTVTVGGEGTAQTPQAQPQTAQYISSVTITTLFDLTPMSSVLVSYKNIFGKYEMPDLDVTFPYVVIRVKLQGTPNLIRLAKQSLSLDLGQSFIVEQTVPQDDKILFLVPTGVKNIYLTDGNGQRQLLYSGRLQPNTIYDGTVEVK